MFDHEIKYITAETARIEYRWRLRQRKRGRRNYRQIDLASFDMRPIARDVPIAYQDLNTFYVVYAARKKAISFSPAHYRWRGKRFVISRVPYESQAQQKSNNDLDRGSIADRWT